MNKADLRKLKKRRKGRLTIHDLNSIQTAYFKKLSFGDYIKLLGTPALVFAFMGHFLFYYYQATIFFAALGLGYGLLKNLPNTVKKNYFNRSYIERNRFLNNFTQLIVNENMPLLDIIEKIIPRLDGELYNDMTVLLARITTADSKMATKAFKDLTDKYSDDIVFCQYFEQIETVFIEGYRNVETFKELKMQHNVFLDKLKDFQKDKEEYGSNFVGTAMLVVIVLAVMIFGIGFEIYKDAFAHHPIGIMCNLLYLVILYVLYSKSMNYMYDDSISTL